MIDQSPEQNKQKVTGLTASGGLTLLNQVCDNHVIYRVSAGILAKIDRMGFIEVYQDTVETGLLDL